MNELAKQENGAKRASLIPSNRKERIAFGCTLAAIMCVVVWMWDGLVVLSHHLELVLVFVAFVGVWVVSRSNMAPKAKRIIRANLTEAEKPLSRGALLRALAKKRVDPDVALDVLREMVADGELELSPEGQYELGDARLLASE